MESKNILVVGGAGYVGSHTCLQLAELGYTPVVFDNLSNGHRRFVQWGPFEQGDIRDRVKLREVFDYYRPSAVMHFAASIEVGQSVENPVAYYGNNVIGSLELLASTLEVGVKRVVFSSTCATYGVPHQVPIDESHPQSPINPYGNTKLIVEKALGDYARYLGLKYVALRYFNAAGADSEGRIGEKHSPETHAIPLAIEAAQGLRTSFKIFGDDYDTQDGSCIRDYIHVSDLAVAHVLALKYLERGGESEAINLGTGTGTSVKELIDAVKSISGVNFPVQVTRRREGDSPILVADNGKARRILGWEPVHDIHDIVESAWNWHNRPGCSE